MVDDFEAAEAVQQNQSARRGPSSAHSYWRFKQGVVFVWDWGSTSSGGAASSRRVAVLRCHDAAASPLRAGLVPCPKRPGRSRMMNRQRAQPRTER